ncbi:MAG: M48 family metallopeptidase [Bacteroidia bacterium]
MRLFMRALYCQLFFILMTHLAAGQTLSKYEPLNYEGGIDSLLRTNHFGNGVLMDYHDLGILPEELSDFTAKNNYYLNSLFKSGYIYSNPEIAAFSRKVSDHLLRDLPDLQQEIQIFICRDAEANGFSTANGYVFLTVGLLSRLENEAQLAFIIAHEIAHFYKNHMALQLNENLAMRQVRDSYFNRHSTNLNSLRFSRQHEFDADAVALQFMIASSYDAREALGSLEAFKPKTAPFRFPIDFNKYYDNKEAGDGIGIDEDRITLAGIFEDYIDGEDDRYNTHPSLQKRAISLKEQLENSRYDPEGKNKFAVSQEEFYATQKIALFEIVELAYNNSSYGESLVYALEAFGHHKNSQYLALKIIQSIYWLSYYKQIELLENVLPMEGELASAAYDSVYRFVDRLSYTELKLIAFNLTKEAFSRFPESEELLFHMGFTSQEFLGQEVARFHYRNYSKKFPQGKYINFVRRQL